MNTDISTALKISRVVKAEEPSGEPHDRRVTWGWRDSVARLACN